MIAATPKTSTLAKVSLYLELLDFALVMLCTGMKTATHFFLSLQPDGVRNYYHTPYLIDLIRYGSIQVPDFDVPVPEQFSVPEVREHLYVPGSAKSVPSLFGECKNNLLGAVF